MCGIVGYTGREAAAPIVLNGLSKLEYRGYDSAGVAVFNEVENDIDIVKTKGRLKNLLEKTDSGKAMPGGCGIGHTRWATHGAPSEKNAHPHCSDDKMVVMVHNGIIENYQELKDHLTQKGYTFYSETDTEVAVKLIAYYYEKTDHNPLESMSRALLRVRGSFALGIMFKDRPGVIYAAGELKHGTISLIEDGTLVIGVLTQSHLCEKTLSNMQEVKSRGAYLMGVAENGSYYLEDMVDFVVYVPKTDPHFTTTLAIIPLQLMGYYVSVARGLDVDKPRNLAKSVTVE